MSLRETPSSIKTSAAPIGTEVDSTPAGRPAHTRLSGRSVTLIALDAVEHAESLYHETEATGQDDVWRYLFEGPYADMGGFRAGLEKKAASKDPLFYAILNTGGRAVGHAAYMRIEPIHRCIEVGSILYTRTLQRTIAGTEAMYLMARHVFEDLGYRRYEWKCNSLNEPSRRAALRYGFKFEGIFRQHMIVKGRNRDTAWFAMLDSDWPRVKANFEKWLDISNFDSEGRQQVSLASLNAING